MDRGEMPSERGDSWFSPKCIEVQPGVALLEVERCLGAGPVRLPTPGKLRMPGPRTVRETAGAKLRASKGKQPRPAAKVSKFLLSVKGRQYALTARMLA